MNIGRHTYVVGGFNLQFENMAKVEVGQFCSIADGVTLMIGGEHNTELISTFHFDKIFNPVDFPASEENAFSKGDIIIGNDVWIGHGVTIMSGVTIQDGSVIGAKSVVTKNISAYEIWAGNPAQFIRRRFEYLQIKKLKEMKWWDWPIEWIQAASRLIQGRDVDALYEYWQFNRVPE
jgi:acetyltransferase-like isoleucine patch superfamily enzyme